METNFDVSNWGEYKILWIESSRIDDCLRGLEENEYDGVGIFLPTRVIGLAILGF